MSQSGGNFPFNLNPETINSFKNLITQIQPIINQFKRGQDSESTQQAQKDLETIINDPSVPSNVKEKLKLAQQHLTGAAQAKDPETKKEYAMNAADVLKEIQGLVQKFTGKSGGLGGFFGS